jgi:hypothetical protein
MGERSREASRAAGCDADYIEALPEWGAHD